MMYANLYFIYSVDIQRDKAFGMWTGEHTSKWAKIQTPFIISITSSNVNKTLRLYHNTHILLIFLLPAIPIEEMETIMLRLLLGNSQVDSQQQTYFFCLTRNYIHYTKTKLRGFSPQANYTDRVTAACRRS
jgi:hypothetical protein